MKKVDFEKSSSKEDIESNIWIMFDILRNENIPSKEYPVILFLLSIYRDGLLGDNVLKERNQPKRKLLEYLGSVSDNQYTDILEYFVPSISKFSENGLNEIFDILKRIDILALSDNFPTIFENVLNRISKLQGRSGISLLSSEIVHLMCSLAELEPNARVFNPFAGLASYGVHLEQKHEYIGQEENLNLWVLGTLRLIAHKKLNNSKYILENPISNWPNPSEKFDLIISKPLYGLRGDYFRGVNVHLFESTGEDFLVRQGIRSLKNDGKLIALLPPSFLSKDEDGTAHEFRKKLIDNEVFDISIISLPSNLMEYFGIPFVILLVNKVKKFGNKVKFVNAKSFIFSDDTRDRVLNHTELANLILSDREVKNVVQLVDKEKIRKNNYNLNVARYLQNPVDGIKLGEILSPVITVLDKKRPVALKLIRTQDLKNDIVEFTINDIVEFTIDLSKIEEISLSHGKSIITESCLLIASCSHRLGNLKPTFFQFNGNAILVEDLILPFKIDEKRADKAYIVNELHADYVFEQMESYRRGNSVKGYMRDKDLMELKIKLPPLQVQREIVRRAKIAYIDSKLKESKLEKEIQYLQYKFNEEVRVKQHCIRQHLKNIIDSIVVINSLMDKQNGTVHVNDIVNPNRNTTVGQRFQAIDKSLRSLSLEIDNLTNDDLYDQPEQIGIRDLLSDCILELGDTKVFSFQEFFDEPILEEYGHNNPSISISRRSFKELFNNIVRNATIHGFIDKKAYQIRIEVTIDDNKLKVSFFNNGKQLAEGLAKQLGVKGIIAGTKAGSGIGIWKIFEIAKYYNFECQIIDQPKDEFPVGWEFKFNLTDID